jgi:GR25 family glycosyltransferase involved in LPS biosynthesis
MLNNYFDKVYVINLDKRKDRLKACKKEFKKIGAKFERVSAIDGSTLDIEIENPKGLRWNKNAYALALTTIKILEEAIEKGYNNILIMEDDIEFHPLFDIIGKRVLGTIPENYDLAFLGYTHTMAPIRYNGYWQKMNAAFSCHAYAVNKHIMNFYLSLLKNLDAPIDHYTNKILGGRLNSFSSKDKLVYQVDGISDIEGGHYEVGFTR